MQQYPKHLYKPDGSDLIVFDASEEKAAKRKGWAERCEKLHGKDDGKTDEQDTQ